MKKVLDFVISRIEDAKLQQVLDLPYYYLDIDGIWPSDFYEELIQRTPDSLKGYSPLSAKYNNRFRYELGHGENVAFSLSDLSLFTNKQDRKFWSEFQKMFIVNKDFPLAIMEKYGDKLFYNPKDPWEVNCRMCKDMTGYSIGVHSDRRDKLFSTIFYTPKKFDVSKRKDWGTQILVAKKGKENINSEIHHAYNEDGSSNDFELHKWVECRPNAMFSWSISTVSFHGVPPVKALGYRDTIQYFAKCQNRNRKILGD